jgi:hypothetical protein
MNNQNYTVEEILHKLKVSQLHKLITLYGLEKPHSKSTKEDLLKYIDVSKLSLDSKMLINYFELKLKSKSVVGKDTEISIEDEKEMDQKPSDKKTPDKKVRKPRSKSQKKSIFQLIE